MFVIETVFISEQIKRYRVGALLEINNKFNSKLIYKKKREFAVLVLHFGKFHNHTMALKNTVAG